MDGVKAAFGRAMAATGALIRVDDMRASQVTHDGTAGTITLTGAATLALVGVDFVGQYRQELLAANLVDVVMQHRIHRQLLGQRTPVLGVVNQLVGSALDVEQPVYQFTIDDVGLHDFEHIVGCDLNICRIVRHYSDDGPLGTEPKTPSGHHIHPTAQSVIGNLMYQPVDDIQASRAVTCRAAATQYLHMAGRDQSVLGLSSAAGGI